MLENNNKTEEKQLLLCFYIKDSFIHFMTPYFQTITFCIYSSKLYFDWFNELFSSAFCEKNKKK